MEKSERKSRDFQEKVEKMESLLQFERDQSAKISRDYSELLGKFTRNSQEFDGILAQKEQEKVSDLLKIQLENQDFKAKLLDFEEICAKMDREIAGKTEEINKLTAFLDQNSLKSRENSEKLASFAQELQRKDQEIQRKNQEIRELQAKVEEIHASFQEKTEEIARNSQENEQELRIFRETLEKDKEKEVLSRTAEIQEVIANFFGNHVFFR